jgi:hypothetical protein
MGKGSLLGVTVAASPIRWNLSHTPRGRDGSREGLTPVCQLNGVLRGTGEGGSEQKWHTSEFWP